MTLSHLPPDGMLPLSKSQENILDAERAFSGTPINNICAAIRIEGRFAPECLQRALDFVVRSDSTLRTRVTKQDGAYMQYIQPFEQTLYPLYDFSAAGESGILHWEEAITREAMPFLDSPLCAFYMFRMTPELGGVVMKTHHIISDGWSHTALANRIAATYLSLLAGREPADAEMPSYSGHIDAERAYLDSARHKADREYWREWLGRGDASAAVHTAVGTRRSPVGRRVTFAVSETLNRRIGAFCSERRVTAFSLFYMALSVYLSRMRGEEGGVTIGVPTFNRMNYTEKRTTGMFVSTLPFGFAADESYGTNRFQSDLLERWCELLRHQRFPFSEIRSLAREVAGAPDPLFDVVLSFQDSRIMDSADARVSFTGGWQYCGYQAQSLCIHICSFEGGHRYQVHYDYLTQLFTEPEIRRLHGYLIRLLSGALEDPNRPLREISMLSPEEYEKVVFTFNATDAPVPPLSLNRMIERVCRENASRVACIYAEKRLRFSDLFDKSRALAARLRSSKAGDAAPVAILLDKGFPLIVSMFGCWLAGRGFTLLYPALPDGRLREILSGSGADIVLTDTVYAHRFRSAGLPLIDVGRAADEVGPSVDELPEPDDAGLAYLIYTSGSTGRPKGCAITRNNLRYYLHAIAPFVAGRAVLSVSNVSFDAFVYESCVALLLGKTVILPDAGQQESPQALAALITGYGVAHMLLTPSRWNAYLKNEAFARAVSRLESAMCGGEALTPELLQRMRECLRCEICNQYGPSETTIGAAAANLPVGGRITIGRPFANCRLYVLDGSRNPLPIGARGELYIGGRCVGAGYWKAAELTEKAFFSSPFEPGETLYKTGDAAFWTEDGEIVVTGRLDGQVKLRGLRVELGEIVARMEELAGVDSAVAAVLPVGKGQVLAAWYCGDASLTDADVTSALAETLPPYMVPSWICRVDAIPRNVNGKADIGSLPAPVADGSAAVARTDAEAKALSAFRKVLSAPELGVEDDFFAFGGDSLRALELIAELEVVFGVRLQTEKLSVLRTARRVAALFDGNERETRPERVLHIRKADRQDRFPPTGTQMGLYFAASSDPTGLAYTMPGMFPLKDEPDTDRLQAACSALIAGEPLLRTSFRYIDGELAGVVENRVELPLERIDADDPQDIWRRFVRPFDLGKAPLIRMALAKDARGVCYLLLDMHHIISDGGSVRPLTNRLRALYEGAPVRWPGLSFVDYAWSLAAAPAGYWAEREEYWRARASLFMQPSETPTDFPRAKHFDFRGGCVDVCMDTELVSRLRRRVAELGVTMFAAMAGALGLLLWKVTGREEIVIGSPVSARRERELLDVSGPLLHTLPLALKLDREQSVADYLRATFAATNDLIDHADVPTDRIAKLSGAQSTLSSNPLYTVLLAYYADDAGVARMPYHNGSAKMDWVLNARDENGGLAFSLEYAKSLYLPDTAAFYARALIAILTSFAADADRPLGAVAALSSADRARLIDRPRRMRAPFVDMRIERQVEDSLLERDAEGVLRFHGAWTTGGDLRRQSDTIAAQLTENGVSRGDTVALVVARGPLLIAGLLAILKCGARYLPAAADTPVERFDYMLRTAACVCVLTDDANESTLQSRELPCPVCVADIAPRTFTPPEGLSTDDDIHVLFTSGSTGKPKGARLTHRNIANLIASLDPYMAGNGPSLCTTSVVFDTFITETLVTLALGGAVLLADEEEMLLPHEVARLIAEGGAAFLQMTPSRMQMCMGSSLFVKAIAGLRVVLLAGEALPPSLAEHLRGCGDFRLINAYGPTETAVYATIADCTTAPVITIGKPVHNSRIYLTDPAGDVVFPTAEGEICIAGENVGLAYIGRPDLTEKAFLPDPFCPGERMYRSGDMGRLLATGEILFTGRRDWQVKLNGRRVELGEITGELLRGGIASEAAVVPLRNADGSMSLRAYVVCAPESVDAVREALRRALPLYMVPSEIVAVPSLPKTATGKTDIQRLCDNLSNDSSAPVDNSALPPVAHTVPDAPAVPVAERIAPVAEVAVPVAPVAESVAPVAEYAAPVAPVAEYAAPVAAPATCVAMAEPDDILCIWRRALHREAVDLRASFFDQGGTSLTALSVLSQYYSHGLTFSLRDFYDHPTLSEQQTLLFPGRSSQVAEPAADATNAGSSVHEADAFGDCFITGATGYLGAHLLYAFLESHSGKAVALVRGGRDRLNAVLDGYFGAEWTRVHAGRIVSQDGDLQMPLLGVDCADPALSGVRVLLHAAADTRHFGSEADSLRNNVGGTEHAFQLAQALSARFLYISTISVSGDSIAADPERRALFDEDDFDIGQNWRDNIYVKSKYLAERFVRERAAAGYPTHIFRVGRLAGRDSDGCFQRNPEANAFLRFSRGLRALNAVPVEFVRTPVEITAVDVAARAILRLADADMPVCHVCAPRPITLWELAEAICPAPELLSGQSFRDRLYTAMSGPRALEMTALADAYNQYLLRPPAIEVSAARTQKQLLRLGFVWPDTPVRRMLSRFFGGEEG